MRARPTNTIMRYFYRCVMCKSGFWYEKGIDDNNLECLHCESSGFETAYDEDLGLVIPKLHRIQVWTNKDGGLELPSYSFECRKCEHKFGLYVGYDRLATAHCPECDAPHDQLDQIYGVPYIISDIDRQEGRTGEDLAMDCFGPDARISSRYQLKEYKKLTRDKYFRDTDGARSVMRPIRNPDTGKISMEKITHVSNGVDLGEIHEVDANTTYGDGGKKNEAEWHEAEKQAAGQIEGAD